MLGVTDVGAPKMQSQCGFPFGKFQVEAQPRGGQGEGSLAQTLLGSRPGHPRAPGGGTGPIALGKTQECHTLE